MKNKFKILMAVLVVFALMFCNPAAFAESGDIQASGPTDGNDHYPYRVDQYGTIRTGYNISDSHTIGSYGLRISGVAEFDENVFMDSGATVAGTATIGTLNMVGNIDLGDGQTFTLGDDGDAILQWDNTNSRFLITLSSASKTLRLVTGNVDIGNGTPTVARASGESLYVEKTGEFAGVLYPLGGIQSADGSNTFSIKDGSGHVAYTCSSGSKNFLITANTVAVTGNETVSGTLIVTGKVTANSGIDAVGTVAVTGSITATGNIQGSGDLNLTDDVFADEGTFTNDVNCVNVVASSNVGGATASTSGLATLDSLTVTNATIHNGTVALKQNTTLDNTKSLVLGDAGAQVYYEPTDAEIKVEGAVNATDAVTLSEGAFLPDNKTIKWGNAIGTPDATAGWDSTGNHLDIVGAVVTSAQVTANSLVVTNGATHSGTTALNGATTLATSTPLNIGDAGAGVEYEPTGATVDASGKWDFGDGIHSQSALGFGADEASPDATIVWEPTGGTLDVTAANVDVSGDINAAGGYKVPFCFSRENADINWTATAVYCQGLESTGNAEYVMPFAGSILAVAAAGTVAQTTGTTVFEVYKNGAGTGLTVTLTDASNYGYATQAKGTDTFVAGDRLELRMTTDGTVSPTTIDYQATVIVEQ